MYFCVERRNVEKWNEEKRKDIVRKIKERPGGDTRFIVLEGESLSKIPRLVAWFILSLA